MSAEHVPQHGKADVAFAGAELKDAWLLIGSLFLGLVMGSFFGWMAYVGLPMLGYFGTKAYIAWKGKHLPGYVTELLYRLGVTGYSAAFDRKQKRFIGDGKVVNPCALQLGAVLRAEAGGDVVMNDADTSSDFLERPVEDGESQLVN
jgi:hypothetical protein